MGAALGQLPLQPVLVTQRRRASAPAPPRTAPRASSPWVASVCSQPLGAARQLKRHLRVHAAARRLEDGAQLVGRSAFAGGGKSMRPGLRGGASAVPCFAVGDRLALAPRLRRAQPLRAAGPARRGTHRSAPPSCTPPRPARARAPQSPCAARRGPAASPGRTTAAARAALGARAPVAESLLECGNERVGHVYVRSTRPPHSGASSARDRPLPAHAHVEHARLRVALCALGGPRFWRGALRMLSSTPQNASARGRGLAKSSRGDHKGARRPRRNGNEPERAAPRRRAWPRESPPGPRPWRTRWHNGVAVAHVLGRGVRAGAVPWRKWTGYVQRTAATRAFWRRCAKARCIRAVHAPNLERAPMQIARSATAFLHAARRCGPPAACNPARSRPSTVCQMQRTVGVAIPRGSEYRPPPINGRVNAAQRREAKNAALWFHQLHAGWEGARAVRCATDPRVPRQLLDGEARGLQGALATAAERRKFGPDFSARAPPRWDHAAASVVGFDEANTMMLDGLAHWISSGDDPVVRLLPEGMVAGDCQDSEWIKWVAGERTKRAERDRRHREARAAGTPALAVRWAVAIQIRTENGGAWGRGVGFMHAADRLQHCAIALGLAHGVPLPPTVYVPTACNASAGAFAELQLAACEGQRSFSPCRRKRWCCCPNAAATRSSATPSRRSRSWCASGAATCSPARAPPPPTRPPSTASSWRRARNAQARWRTSAVPGQQAQPDARHGGGASPVHCARPSRAALGRTSRSTAREARRARRLRRAARRPGRWRP